MDNVLNLIIVGAGGLGREVYHWAKDCFSQNQYRFKGFLTNRPNHLDGFDYPISIIGDPATYVPEDNDRFLYAIGDTNTKKELTTRLKSRGATFIRLIHPTATVSSTARLNEGVVICPYASVSCEAVIGDFVLLNIYASCAHDTKVGRYSILSPYATINGWVELKEGVFLGTHAAVTAGKKVGRYAKISVNSCVMYDVPENAFVVGVPGKNHFLPKN